MLLLQGRPLELQQDGTVATLRTLFIGTAERHEIYFSCLLSLKAKVKKHDRYLLVPNRGKKSLSLLRQLEPNIDT